MRKIMVEAAATAALIIGATLAWQQPSLSPPKTDVKPPELKPEPAKSKLEEMIEKALHDNPDLRLAEAKLAEAEAELNKARLLVVQKVAAQYQAVEAQKAAVDGAAAELEETKTAYKAASVSQSMVRTAEQKLIDAKAKLASLEAELPYLLGQQAEGKIDAKIRLWLDRIDISQPPKNADAEYLRRRYLDVIRPRADGGGNACRGCTSRPSKVRRPTVSARRWTSLSIECKEQRRRGHPEDESEFQDANPGLLIKNNNAFSNNGGNISAPHKSKYPSVRPWSGSKILPKYRIVVRDYGLVIAPKEDRRRGHRCCTTSGKGRRRTTRIRSPERKTSRPKSSRARSRTLTRTATFTSTSERTTAWPRATS